MSYVQIVFTHQGYSNDSFTPTVGMFYNISLRMRNKNVNNHKYLHGVCCTLCSSPEQRAKCNGSPGRIDLYYVWPRLWSAASPWGSDWHARDLPSNTHTINLCSILF